MKMNNKNKSGGWGSDQGLVWGEARFGVGV